MLSKENVTVRLYIRWTLSFSSTVRRQLILIGVVNFHWVDWVIILVGQLSLLFAVRRSNLFHLISIRCVVPFHRVLWCFCKAMLSICCKWNTLWCFAAGSWSTESPYSCECGMHFPFPSCVPESKWISEHAILRSNRPHHPTPPPPPTLGYFQIIRLFSELFVCGSVTHPSTSM